MKDFKDALQKTASSPHHDKMLKMSVLLQENFGINHFWYYKITHQGHFSYFGSNMAWNEYCIENELIKHSPNIRPPDTQPSGINFVASGVSTNSKEVLDVAWDKFRLNFNLLITQKVSSGVEAFGFATKYKDSWADQRLLNDMPVLKHFTKVFKKEHQKLFNLIDEYSIDVATKFGEDYYNRPKILTSLNNPKNFLEKLGYADILSLAPRELSILKYLYNGYPAAYIAQELHLSKKTVENYLATLKDKLNCATKVDLILKAKSFFDTGYFDL